MYHMWSEFRKFVLKIGLFSTIISFYRQRFWASLWGGGWWRNHWGGGAAGWQWCREPPEGNWIVEGGRPVASGPVTQYPQFATGTPSNQPRSWLLYVNLKWSILYWGQWWTLCHGLYLKCEKCVSHGCLFLSIQLHKMRDIELTNSKMVSDQHLMAIGWQQVSPRNTNVRLLHWICGGLLWQDTVFLLESGSVSVWNMQESGSDEECSEESSSSAEEEDAEFSANEEDGKKPKIFFFQTT